MNDIPVTTREIGPYLFNFVLRRVNDKDRRVIQIVESGTVIWESRPHKNKEKLTRKWIIVGQAFLVGHLEGLKQQALARLFDCA